jgi:predicted amidohydrolase
MARGGTLMRIALLQMAAVPGQVSDNLASIESAAVEAARAGAELLIAPELATVGYGAGDAIRSLAEPRDGAQITALSSIAAAHGLAIIAGFPERDGDHVYNSAAFTDPHTEPVIYRKSHLYDAYERSLFTPGDPTATIAMWRGIRIGLLICYDVEFPENVRRLALGGADLVAVPTALPTSPNAAFISERMIPVRAFENQIFVAYANHTGQDERFTYVGLSHVASPDGRTQAIASAAQTGIILAEIRPQDYAVSRARNSYLSDLRLGARSGSL